MRPAHQEGASLEESQSPFSLKPKGAERERCRGQLLLRDSSVVAGSTGAASEIGVSDFLTLLENLDIRNLTSRPTSLNPGWADRAVITTSVAVPWVAQICLRRGRLTPFPVFREM